MLLPTKIEAQSTLTTTTKAGKWVIVTLQKYKRELKDDEAAFVYRNYCKAPKPNTTPQKRRNTITVLSPTSPITSPSSASQIT